NVSDADREARSCKPEQEGRGQKDAEALGAGDERDRSGHGHHESPEDEPATEPVGEHADRDPGERAQEDGYSDEQRRLSRGEMEASPERGSEGAHQPPRGEADGERHRPKTEVKGP